MRGPGGCWSPSHLNRIPVLTRVSFVFLTDMSMIPPEYFPTLLLTAGAFGTCISTWLLIRRSRCPPFPPGPSPDPVIGNLRHMGSGNLEFVFEKWGKKYGGFSSWCGRGNQVLSLSQSSVTGPLNHVLVLGQHLVVLNSFNDARELLDHRGGIYSSRPRLVTFSEMCVSSPAFVPSVSAAIYEIPIVGWDGDQSSLRCIPDRAGKNIAESFKRSSVPVISMTMPRCRRESHTLFLRAWVKLQRNSETTLNGKPYRPLPR